MVETLSAARDVAQAQETAREKAIGENVAALRKALSKGDRRAILRALPLADTEATARLLESLGDDELKFAVSSLRGGAVRELLPRLSEELVAKISPLIGEDETVRAIEELPSDDAVSVVEKIEEPRREEILEQLPSVTRYRIEKSLAYPENSAARLMQSEYASVPRGWNVGRVIDYMREEKELPDKFYDIQVVNPKNQVVGVLPLDILLRSPRGKSVAAIMEKSFSFVKAATDQEVVADLFRKKDLTSMPVVDEADRLIGVVTVDDIVDVIDEEAGEDILKLSGVAAGYRFYGGFGQVIKRRFGWLLLNLAFTFVAALVIGIFTDSIRQLVALAMFMPIAASMGGVAAVQTLAVTVRALVMRNILRGRQLRAIGREMTVNALVGALLGAFAALGSELIAPGGTLSIVVGVAVAVNVFFGGFLGVAIPIALKRAGIDPAVASGPCATIGTDIFGLLTFLGLATLYAV